MQGILESLKAIEERLAIVEQEHESGHPLSRAESDILEGLRAIDLRLTAIEATLNQVPAIAVHQALKDILHIYSATGQTASVVKIQAEQIQALAEAYERMSVALTAHDSASSLERADIKELMVQLRELARDHVRGLVDVARAVGVDDLPSERKRRKDNPAA